MYKKYAHKKFLKASTYAVQWARANYDAEVAGVDADAESIPPASEGMFMD